jgi:hypothetical protein
MPQLLTSRSGVKSLSSTAHRAELGRAIVRLSRLAARALPCSRATSRSSTAPETGAA